MGAFTIAMIYLCIASCVFWLGAKIAYKIVSKKRKDAERESAYTEASSDKDNTEVL